MERVDLENGKYSVINDNGELTALRYGEPWKKDISGDNLIYALVVEILKLKKELNDSEKLVDTLNNFN